MGRSMLAHVNGQEFVAALKRLLGARSDRELAAALGVTNVTLHNWRKSPALTARGIAQQIAKMARQLVPGQRVVEKIMRKLGHNTYNKTAAALGITPIYLGRVRKQRHLSEGAIAGLIASTIHASQHSIKTNAIRPIVEFFKLDRVLSRYGAKQELFAVKTSQGHAHPYRSGLREQLESAHGVYIFYDSRGRALYAGKARMRELWGEMTSAFNRYREIQQIKRVRHPTRQQAFRSGEEISRQISPATVKLHELAVYFSAYKVDDDLIDELESLLVRSFPNDLLNVRMERFSRQRSGKDGTQWSKRRRRKH